MILLIQKPGLDLEHALLQASGIGIFQCCGFVFGRELREEDVADLFAA